MAVALLTQAVPRAFGLGGLDDRFNRISDSAASATSTHLMGMTFTNTTSALGSLDLEFCSNTPLPATPCTAPVGLDLTTATIGSQSGATGFSIHANSTVNRLILTRVPSVLGTSTASTYRIDGVVNPSIVGSYYVRVQTFSSTDATGLSVEDGGLAFAITQPVTISTEVPPYLTFCTATTITGLDCSSATSYIIDFGEFVSSKVSTASSQFMVATNAANGFTVSITGTTLTSGTNTIPPFGVPSPPVVGGSQFGINLRSNPGQNVGSDPVGPGLASPAASYNVPGLYKYSDGDALVTSSGTTDLRKFTVSYITTVSSGQAPGVYSSTYTYIALANF
jgi:hypothetical protein